MFQAERMSGCSLSIKTHWFHNDFNFVPKNLWYVSDKCGEQDLLGNFKDGESLPGEMQSSYADWPVLVAWKRTFRYIQAEIKLKRKKFNTLRIHLYIFHIRDIILYLVKAKTTFSLVCFSFQLLNNLLKVGKDVIY